MTEENETLNLTIAQPTARYEQEIKKSRFILDIARVSNEEVAQAFVEKIRKQEHKATHNVWTYVLGPTDLIQRYSDDGEPAGTAGVPMLEVLKNNQLHDVVAVVTRYFGGIKLGAGGLIRAYAGTVADGIAQIGLVNQVLQQEVCITVGYAQYESLKYWLEQAEYQILDTQYGADVTLIVGVNKSNITEFEAQVTDTMAGQASFSLGEERIVEVPYSRSVSAQTSSLK
ncbi:putative YigZ family protein [Weissella uvarum]|uniref:YigZ family protein n=1 Tax=Weissella uvarum TaxID=1479233 RepID=UPI001961E24C|nr:YigZ family protein [Weissella uvarum]MBM7618079.1 putative YigZ family protein [Weissella uvarum]MCM0595933.1 YigZ family protein [Weissella uvarum]